MHFIYSLVLYFLVPFVVIRLGYLGRKNPDYLMRWPERFGFTPVLDSRKDVIWIHAVSVGEIMAARPLVEHLLGQYTRYQILVTTITPTGAATAMQVFPGAVEHRYFPYDLPFSVARFLRIIKPRVLLVLETEIWPNLYKQCRSQHVPVALLNARLSGKSLKGYRLLSGLTKATLEQTSIIATQTAEDAQRFISIGAPPDRVVVSGNLKFDIKMPHSVFEQGQGLRNFFSVNRPVWIAASTHEGEEKIILDALKIICEQLPDSLLIIAPRQLERFRSVRDVFTQEGYKTVCYTNREEYATDVQVFVLDTFGQLPVYYAAADVAFVGGSMVPAGGHNMLEPASLGLPILSGKYLFNFSEVTRLLTGAGALSVVGNAQELAHKVVGLFGDPNLRFNLGERAKAVVTENQGSINKIVKVLEGIIP